MKNYFTFLMFCSLLISSNLFGQTDTTVIGEIRYKNNGGPLFWKKFDYQFYYKAANNETIPIEAKLNPKEVFYKSNQGTEVIFYFGRDTHLKNGTATVFGKFFVTLANNQRVIKSETDPINVDISYSTKLNQYTFKLNYPIEISSPEKFSLTMMINYVNETLTNPFFSSYKDLGYSNIVDNLENYKDNFYDDKKTKYTTLIDFYKLLVFTQDYVDQNSFFNSEAKKLKKHITQLNFQLSDSISGKKLDIYQYQDLLEDLIASNEIYEEYLKLSGKLKDYNSRLQLILFLKSK